MSVYRGKVGPSLTRKPPQISVEAHSSPSLLTPRVMPSSPNMIPAFTFIQDEVTNSVISNNVQNESLKRSRTLVSGKYRNSNNGATVLKNQRKYRKPVVNEPLRFSNQSYRKTQQKSTSSQQTKSSQTSSVGKSSTLTNIVKPPLKLQKRPHTSRDDTRKDNSFTSYLNNEYPPYNPSDFALAQTEDQSEFTLDHSVRKQNPQTYSDKQDLLKKIREELSLWTAGSSMEKKKSCPEQWTSAPPENTEKSTMLQKSSKR